MYWPVIKCLVLINQNIRTIFRYIEGKGPQVGIFFFFCLICTETPYRAVTLSFSLPICEMKPQIDVASGSPWLWVFGGSDVSSARQPVLMKSVCVTVERGPMIWALTPWRPMGPWSLRLAHRYPQTGDNNPTPPTSQGYFENQMRVLCKARWAVQIREITYIHTDTHNVNIYMCTCVCVCKYMCIHISFIYVLYILHLCKAVNSQG